MRKSSKVSRRRLMVLIRHMEKLPPAARRHFSMHAFLDHDSPRHDHVVPRSTRELLHSCGTSACALGFAATMPYFRRLGLRFRGPSSVPVHRGVIVPRFSPLWTHLFGGNNDDVSPKAWAKRARAVLADPKWW